MLFGYGCWSSITHEFDNNLILLLFFKEIRVILKT